jgi:hypothetical protein
VLLLGECQFKKKIPYSKLLAEKTIIQPSSTLKTLDKTIIIEETNKTGEIHKKNSL